MKDELGDALNYQLAWTIVLVGSWVGLWVERDIGESCLQILCLLSESVLSNCLKCDIDVDALFGWCLEIWNIILGLAPLLGAFRWHLKRMWEHEIFPIVQLVVYSQLDSPDRSCFPTLRMESALGYVDSPGSGIRRAKNQDSWMCWELLCQRRERSSRHRDRKQRRAIGSVLGRPCPKSRAIEVSNFVYLAKQ